MECRLVMGRGVDENVIIKSQQTNIAALKKLNLILVVTIKVDEIYDKLINLFNTKKRSV